MCIFKFQWHNHHLIIILLLTTTLATTISQPQPPLPPPSATHNPTLKPSMTIIIGLLTTIFSITFLLLLYAKHCRRSNDINTPYIPSGHVSAYRGNSGIDRTIIESLPVFRFGSLTGQKDGLECAVCLSRFNRSEVLRLLPKCKHAFHVECVDTWLDAHSTCPLCRYRVDPEDIFLILGEHDFSRDIEITSPEVPLRRVSGRHSSAGEKVTSIQISTDSPARDQQPVLAPTKTRTSLDSFVCKHKISKKTKKKEEILAVEKQRKDGLLLAAESVAIAAEERRRRFEHRIVVGTSGAYRWSDVQPSDLLYLRSDDVRRLKRSRPSVLHEGRNNGCWQNNNTNNGRNEINSRSMSEMTGLSRFGSNEEAGVLSRWLARLSSEPKSGRTSSSNV